MFGSLQDVPFREGGLEFRIAPQHGRRQGIDSGIFLFARVLVELE